MTPATTNRFECAEKTGCASSAKLHLPASRWIRSGAPIFSSAPTWKSGRDLTDCDRAGLLCLMRPTIGSVLCLCRFGISFGCNKPATPTAPAQASPPAPANPTISAAAPAKPAESAPAPGPGKYGAPLSNAEAIAAKTVIADPLKWNDKDVKLTGKVSGVCQKRAAG